jgi:hypothetical protein
VRPKWPGVESETVTGGKRATLTEASLLLAVFFLGTNPVAVKLAVADVPRCPSWRCGSSWRGSWSSASCCSLGRGIGRDGGISSPWQESGL